MDHNAYRTALTQSSAGTERFFPPAEFTERRSRVARAMLAAGSEFMSLQPIVTSGPRIGVIHLNHQ